MTGTGADPEDPMESPDWWETIEEPNEYEAAHEPAPADAAAIAELKPSAIDDDLPEDARKRFASIDWVSAFQTDFSVVDWLPGSFMERGQQITIVGDGKVGKSLFALDWCYRMAAGRPFLGDRAHEPLRVLYFDRENSLRDVVTRLQGFGATPSVLSNLIYKPFPQFSGTLDVSTRAAAELVGLTELHKGDVVILDTVSRFIGGKENDSDTWLQLYQLVHAKLKARGIACVRLDHFGKDSERGSRGSSAKSQDVDAVWELSKAGEKREQTGDRITVVTTLKMARTHTRSGLGEDRYTIVRSAEKFERGMWIDGRTRHGIAATDGTSVVDLAMREVDLIVEELLAAGVPTIRGRGTLTDWLRSQKRPTYRNDLLADVTRALKERQAEGA